MSVRIIHTADWHLGDRLGGLERLPDQLQQLRALARHAEQRRADALLVCGDVLEEARPERLAEVISELAELLAPSIARGMECIFLAGNHDSVHTFDLLDGMQLLLGRGHRARVRFIKRPTVMSICAGETPAATLVALPYPGPGVYAVDGDPRSVADKHAALREAVARKIEELCQRAAQEYPGLPLVMAGHFLLSQVQAGTGAREVAEAEDIRVGSERLNDFAYVALGHVHQPLVIGERVRYSGALDRVDFGEADEPRHVVLAEITADGGLTLEELPLDPTPMRRFAIGAFEELSDTAQMVDDPARTIVKLELHLGRDDSASLWIAESREHFPRLAKPIELVRLDDPDPPLLTGEVEHGGPAETVRAFLADQLDGDPDAKAVLAMAEELLGEEGLSGS